MTKLRLRVGLVASTLFLTACPPPGNGLDGGGDGGTDGGNGDGGCGGQFCVQEVEGAAGAEAKPLEAVLLPGDRIGIAYYHQGPAATDGGFELRYREWNAGVVSAPTTVDTVHRVVGLGMDKTPDGEPAVTYLGGNYPSTEHAFWFQNDQYLAYRQGGGWQTTVVAEESGEAATGVGTSDLGFLVGLHSDLAFNGSDVFVVWRDCHNGQFPQQDWQGSDLEVARGTLTGFAEKRVIIASDGDTIGKQGFAGHNRMIIADGQPVVVGDKMGGGADTIGSGTAVFRRNPDGSWLPPEEPFGAVANTQSGPVIAWDSTLGYALAVVDANSNLLRYVRSTSPTSIDTWTTPENVVQSGTSGWYPSIAIDPAFHEPHIAYYHCDNRSTIAAHQCRESDDELRIIARIGAAGNWRDTVVDRAGGYQPKLLFLSTGKRVVVYRDPRTYAVKLALEP